VYQTDLAILPTLEAAVSTLAEVGWAIVTIDAVLIESGLTRRQDLARLKHRALSTLEQLSPDVIDNGLRRINTAVTYDTVGDAPVPSTLSDLLVFRNSKRQDPRHRGYARAPGRREVVKVPHRAPSWR
jgi:hypothetical protein